MEKGYNPYTEIKYDKDFNLMYIEVHPHGNRTSGFSKSRISGEMVTNLGIYDIGEDNLVHFFEKGSKKKIISYHFEVEYFEDQQRIIFNDSRGYPIFNNHEITKRKCANKLFLHVQNLNSTYHEYWVSNKSGDNKKMILESPKELDWRIDVKNQKILFVEKLDNEVQVKAFDW